MRERSLSYWATRKVLVVSLCKVLFFFFLNGKLYFVGVVGRGPVLELLKLHLGASSLGEVHVEAHCLAQRPALTHCGNIEDLDIPKAGGKVHGHILTVRSGWCFWVVEVVSVMPVVLCIFILATKQDPHLDGDDTIGKERAFLLHISAPQASFGVLKTRSMFLLYHGTVFLPVSLSRTLFLFWKMIGCVS